MEIASKEAQNMDMDERDSQMEYDEEVNLTKKRMATQERKDKNKPKEKVTRKKTPQQQRRTGRQPKKRKTERM
jgi:hypothetical protein